MSAALIDGEFALPTLDHEFRPVIRGPGLSGAIYPCPPDEEPDGFTLDIRDAAALSSALTYYTEFAADPDPTATALGQSLHAHLERLEGR